MQRDPSEDLPVDQQVVDPGGLEALEEIAGGHDAQVALELEQGLVDLVDEVELDGVVEDGVAVPAIRRRCWSSSVVGLIAVYVTT
jgi:hypothetical protein